MYASVYSSFVCNTTKLETNQVPFNADNKLWCIYIMDYLLLNKKREQITACFLLLYIPIDAYINSQRIMQGKEANPKRLHSVWFHSFKVTEMKKL